MIGSISRALIQRYALYIQLSVSQSLLHREVLNTALSAHRYIYGRPEKDGVKFYSAEVKSKVEKTLCTCM